MDRTKIAVDDFEKISQYICENCRFGDDDMDCWENSYVCPITSELDELEKLCTEIYDAIDNAYRKVW